MPEVKLKLTSSEITGNPSAASWVQVVVGKEEVLDKGKFFLLVNIKTLSSEHPYDQITPEKIALLGRELAEKFEEDYIETKDTAFNSLNVALEKLKTNLSDKNVAVGSEIAAGVLADDVLYLGTLGTAKILLIRDGIVINLVEGEEKIVTVSGHVKPDDILFFTTSGFNGFVGESSIKHTLLSFKTPEEIVADFAPQVMGSEKNDSFGCLGIKLIPEEPVITEVVAQVPEKSLEKQEEDHLHFSMSKNTFFSEKKVQLESLGKIIKTKLFSVPDKVEFSFQKNKKKQALIVAIILIVVLSSSVVFGLKKKEEVKFLGELEKTYQDAKLKYDEGSAILELNNTQARNFLSEAKQELESKLTLVKNNKEPEYVKSAALLSQINDALSSVGGVYKASAPEVFYDLTLIKDKATGQRLALYKKNVAVLDVKNKTIYKLSLDSKAGEVVAGDRDTSGVNFIAQGTKIYFYSDKDGVKTINPTTKKITTVIKKEEAWGQIGDLAAFGSNVYLLDKTKGQILKFVELNDGFSNSRNYLAKDLTPDFSQSMSLTIDGFVWVLNSEGTIVKFAQGNPDNFSPSGVEPALSKPTRIFTSEDTKNIYVLESPKNRVVVLGKDGVYQAQYLWSGPTASDLVVLEDSKKILLLSGSKIYSLNLK